MNYDKMSREELVEALRSLESAEETPEDEQHHLVHELQVHQIELEMQNRELREVQQALETSRDRYADLYDFAPVSYVTLDEEGIIREINLTGAALLRTERANLIGKPFLPFLVRRDVAAFMNHLRQCKGADERVATEVLLRTRDQRQIDVQLFSVRFRDAERQTSLYRTAITDITGHKREERMLREGAALDRVRASVYKMRESADIQKVLDSLYEVLKENHMEFDNCSVEIVEDGKNTLRSYRLIAGQVHLAIARPLTNSAPYDAWRNKRTIYRQNLDAEDRYRERAGIREVFAAPIRSVLDVPFSGGTIAINSVQSEAFSEEDIETLGQFAGVLSEAYTRFEDIQRVETSSRQWQNTFDAIGDMVAIIDRDYRVLQANQAMHRTFEGREIIGAHCYELFHGTETSPIGCSTCKVFQSGETVHEKKHEQHLGDRWLDIFAYPIKDEDNTVQQVVHVVRDITEQLQIEEELKRADERLSVISDQEAIRWGITGFVGRSKTIRGILRDVHRLQSTGTTSVLITGESGTGKELIARAIHYGGTRGKAPFIPANCAAVPSELMESLFFGHVPGAFTGAISAQKGYFELADGGTLFLDEIGDMPLELQPKLLRVLEDNAITPLGAEETKSVSVRIVATTNQDLQRKIAEGTFREDLYFRLARFTVGVPPLRHRPEDIPLLAHHFLTLFGQEMGMRKVRLSGDALSVLMAHPFPGNVRELKNIIESALLRSGGSTILPEHLSFIERDRAASPYAGSGHSASEQSEALLVRRAQAPPREIGGAGATDTPSSAQTDEEKILAYAREHGSINNMECRDLLSVDAKRASYLLKKIHRYGLLKREGERRWAYYRLGSD